MTKTDYRIEYRCKHCECVISYSTIMYSHGLCPQCGYKTKGTVIENTIHPYRYRKWWQFLQKSKREYLQEI